MIVDPGTDAGEEAAITGKAYRSAQARCALLGAALEESTDDRDQRIYVVSRGPWTVRLQSLPEVEAWLRVREWVLRREEAAG